MYKGRLYDTEECMFRKLYRCNQAGTFRRTKDFQQMLELFILSRAKTKLPGLKGRRALVELSYIICKH